MGRLCGVVSWRNPCCRPILLPPSFSPPPWPAARVRAAAGKYRIWDSFMQSVEPLSSQMPYMVGVGNHEYDYRDGYENDPSGEQPYHPGW